MKSPVLKTCLCRVGVLVPPKVIHIRSARVGFDRNGEPSRKQVLDCLRNGRGAGAALGGSRRHGNVMVDGKTTAEEMSAR